MSEQRSKIGALVITAIMALMLMLALVYCSVTILVPHDTPLVQQPDSIILADLGGDPWVKLGDLPDPNLADEPAAAQDDNEAATDPEPQQEAHDLHDAGEPAPTPPKPITSTQPSPMKVKEKPKEEKKPEVKPKTGPSKPNDKPTAQPKAKSTHQAQPAESKIAKGMKGAFAKSGGNGPSSGSPGGTAGGTSLKGQPGLGGGLVGWTVAQWGRPHSPHAGSVTVQVRVNARGKVVSARAVSGSGAAWGDAAVRKSCEQESLKSAFSVPENRTTEGQGTITWRFK